MAVDGTWNLTMDTPMGERSSTLIVKAAGGTLEGTQSAEGQTAAIVDGAVDGNAMSGTVQLGMFGSSPFRATRA
jgi:hypothetical protein